MRTICLTILVVVTARCLSAETPPTSNLVFPGPDGKLHYKAGDFGTTIPDFSTAGYRNGGVALPDVPVKVALEPAADGDDSTSIQTALDQVSTGGAVLLKRGTWRCGTTLRVGAGVVLRGEGQDADGTVIIATMGGANEHHTDLIEVGGKGSLKEEAGTRQEITDDVVAIGARKLSVKNPATFKPGDRVIVHRPATAEWIHDLKMDKIEGAKTQWTPTAYGLSYERQVREVTSTGLVLDAPLVQSLERKYGGGQVWRVTDERNRESGVERLRLVSSYKAGEQAKDEDHAWNAVHIQSAADCWVREVTALHFAYACVSIDNASRITVQDCAMIDPASLITGGRRYSFNVCGQAVLVQRCYARNGRHDYVTGGRVCGPNAFVDCLAEKTHSDSGPHHRWATGEIYDNVQAGSINVQDRGRMGTGHGWAGNAQVFWNCVASSFLCQRPWVAGCQNWAIGCIGKPGKPYLPGRPEGVWESLGKPVAPRSLYAAQLTDHGKPLAAVFTSEQLAGPIWEQLRQRYGKEPEYP